MSLNVLTIVSMGVLTWKGATAQEALASEVKQNIPRWIKDEKLPPAARPGVELFATSGCTACHTYDGAGGSLLLPDRFAQAEPLAVEVIDVDADALELRQVEALAERGSEAQRQRERVGGV